MSQNKRKNIRVSLQLAWADLIIHSQREIEVLFLTLKNPPFPLTQSIKLHISALVRIPCLIPCHRCKKYARESVNSLQFDHATWQYPRESPRHVHESARIYDVRMAQFVLKIEKLSHIIGARESRDLRSPSPIMAPDWINIRGIGLHQYSRYWIESIFQVLEWINTPGIGLNQYSRYWIESWKSKD